MLNHSNVMWYWYISFMFCLPWLVVVSPIMLSEWSTQTQMVVRFQTSANANIKENCLTGYLCSLLFVWYELFVIDLKTHQVEKSFHFSHIDSNARGGGGFLASPIYSKLMDSDSEYYYFYQEKEELPILLQVYCLYLDWKLLYNKMSVMKCWMLQDIPTSEILWYHVLFFAVMFLLIGLDWVMTRLCQ